jgi:phosphoribosylamine---glycine ligase
MKVLVVGSGGREHALVWKLVQSPKKPELFCAPGNPGIAKLATCVDIAAEDIEGLLAFALQHQVDLTVVGPEAPLAKGIVDRFREKGLPIFGPTREGAQIESSKSWAKQLMLDAGIPTATYRVFTDLAAAKEYVRSQPMPIVLKADGLAAGKGVVVARSAEEALRSLEQMMQEQIFGQAGAQVVIEQFLKGSEATVMAFVDGLTYRLMVPVQDHKPVFDGNTGPNTGGMGTYSPVPDVTPAILHDVETRIFQPLLKEFQRRGIHYRGVLYAGLMLTKDGPYVIEFNCRFGDPETQVVLPRLETDLLDVCLAIAGGDTAKPNSMTLEQMELVWKQDNAVCVIVAAGGYPGSYKKGDVIQGLDAAERVANGIVFHAGTAWQDGDVVTNGGRVLGVTCLGATLRDARAGAYALVEQIRFRDMHYRTDIAKQAAESQTV